MRDLRAQMAMLEAGLAYRDREIERLDHLLTTAQQDYRQLVGIVSSGTLGKPTLMPEFSHDIFAEVGKPTEEDYLTPAEGELLPVEDLEAAMHEQQNDRNQTS